MLNSSEAPSLSLSDALRVLRERGHVETSIAVGACLDGDVECVSAASALLWCAAEGFDVVVCAIGPGIVGTGSTFGHGGVAAADAANAAQALHGTSILAVRASERDPRERHQGVSHHARAVLELCLGDAIAPWPAATTPRRASRSRLVDVRGWEKACAGLPLAHMGRGPQEDPLFFTTAFAAGRAAASLIR
jgi:hypothetical protein